MQLDALLYKRMFVILVVVGFFGIYLPPLLYNIMWNSTIVGLDFKTLYICFCQFVFGFLCTTLAPNIMKLYCENGQKMYISNNKAWFINN